MNLKLSIFVLLIFLSACNDTTEFKDIEYINTYKFAKDIEVAAELDTVPWKYQLSAGDYAIKGDYQNALIHWDLAMGGRDRNYSPAEIDSLNELFTPVDATDYIVKQAEDYQIVIINEAHHNSFHRVYTRSLLQKLYGAGYRNLGLEALSNGTEADSLLNERKYPIKKTGYYVNDPQFGNLVRTALDIGYYVYPYEETTGGNGKEREIQQAKNIQKLMESKPNEKFLIHCGFDHVLEGEHRSWEKALAARLHEYTGIDPLTIDQVQYSEKSRPEYNHPMLKAFNVKQPSILIDQYNNPYGYTRGNAWTDLAIFHPITDYENDRPEWLFQYGNQKVTLDLSEIKMDFPVMVLAFNKNENIEEAIPIDITEVNSVQDTCYLGLPSGAYQILVTNNKMTVGFNHRVEY